MRAHAWLAFALLLIGGCSRPTPEGAAEGGDDAAPSSGRVLHLYTAFDTHEARAYIEAFEKETGIDVEWVRLSSGELLTRVRNEAANPQVSVWFGGPFTDFIAATNEGLLAPYPPHVDYPLVEGSYDPEGHWVGISMGAIGFVSNKEILARKKLEPPDSWERLLDPAFRNEVSMAYAYTSGTAYTILASIIQGFGEEEGFRYLQRLHRNVHHYNKSGSACVTQASLGEIGVCIAFSQDALKKGVSKGFPVTLTFPAEGTGYEFAAVAVVKGAREPQLARRFVDWILSPAGQGIMPDFFRIPVSPHVRLPAGFPDLDDVKLFPFDAQKAGAEKKRLIERWREITRR